MYQFLYLSCEIATEASLMITVGVVAVFTDCVGYTLVACTRKRRDEYFEYGRYSNGMVVSSSGV